MTAKQAKKTYSHAMLDELKAQHETAKATIAAKPPFPYRRALGYAAGRIKYVRNGSKLLGWVFIGKESLKVILKRLAKARGVKRLTFKELSPRDKAKVLKLAGGRKIPCPSSAVEDIAHDAYVRWERANYSGLQARSDRLLDKLMPLSYVGVKACVKAATKAYFYRADARYMPKHGHYDSKGKYHAPRWVSVMVTGKKGDKRSEAKARHDLKRLRRLGLKRYFSSRSNAAPRFWKPESYRDSFPLDTNAQAYLGDMPAVCLKLAQLLAANTPKGHCAKLLGISPRMVSHYCGRLALELASLLCDHNPQTHSYTAKPAPSESLPLVAEPHSELDSLGWTVKRADSYADHIAVLLKGRAMLKPSELGERSSGSLPVVSKPQFVMVQVLGGSLAVLRQQCASKGYWAHAPLSCDYVPNAPKPAPKNETAKPAPLLPQYATGMTVNALGQFAGILPNAEPRTAKPAEFSPAHIAELVRQGTASIRSR